jgi:hypothetical protein
MQASGQISAHMQQPRQSAFLLNLAGLNPLRFNFLSWLIAAFGQKLMQSKHPLHFSLSMLILGIKFI